MEEKKTNPLKENPEGLFGVQWHITDKAGSYKKTLETIPMLIHAGIQTGIVMTVSEMNYKELPGDHMPAGCHCGNGTIAISADGTVMACRRMEGSAHMFLHRNAHGKSSIIGHFFLSTS